MEAEDKALIKELTPFNQMSEGDVSALLGQAKVVSMPKGKMIDLGCCAPIDGFDSSLTGTFDYADIADSDVVIVTAGLPRKPGMSRDDLIETNVKIVKSVSENIREYAPDSIVILVSNPLDAMVYTAWKATGFPTNRIVGQAGALDVARFRAFLAMEIGCSIEDISARIVSSTSSVCSGRLGTNSDHSRAKPVTPTMMPAPSLLTKLQPAK